MEQIENAQQDDTLEVAQIRLLQRLNQGNPAPAKVNKLRLKDIQSLPSVFQHRSNNRAASESHVSELIKCLSRNPEQPFSPLVVYWVGDGWCVIDGHHRLEAYHEMQFKQLIPVTVFAGTLEDAMTLAASSNTKDKLSMTRIEKSNAAWRLVIGTAKSKSAIARATCVSERSVAYMRAVKASLSVQRPERALSGLSWIDAMKLEKGNNIDTHKGSSDWVEKEADELAARLTKLLGRRLSHNYEVTIRALEKYDDRICEAISDWYSDQENDYGDAPIHQLAHGEEF